MKNVKLPRPFRNAMSSLFPLGNYSVTEVYLDENYGESPNIRDYLGIPQGEPTCDCFCKVIVNGQPRYILLEDKKTKDYREAQRAIEQLINTYNKAKNKNITISYIILCRFKPDNKIFKSANNMGSNLKELRTATTNKTIKIEDVPILLYNK